LLAAREREGERNETAAAGRGERRVLPILLKKGKELQILIVLVLTGSF
jgi:hypothetical protein